MPKLRGTIDYVLMKPGDTLVMFGLSPLVWLHSFKKVGGGECEIIVLHD